MEIKKTPGAGNNATTNSGEAHKTPQKNINSIMLHVIQSGCEDKDGKLVCKDGFIEFGKEGNTIQQNSTGLTCWDSPDNKYDKCFSEKDIVLPELPKEK